MVSIIIVNYNVKKELFACLDSIISSNPKTPYEIIIVDNDEQKTIQEELFKKFPTVKYIPNDNKGFGQANNTGAKHANGEYLFFLNPDTKFINNSIDILIKYLNSHKNIAIVTPLLYDPHNKPYKLQGIRKLTPLRAIFSLSFISKLFPNNKIYKDYYLLDWDKNTIKEVDACPGTVILIRKKLFQQIGGFDEKFFLFFEEFDLCKRVRELGCKIVINPYAKVLHYWGLSTQTRPDAKKIFVESRFYYFKKNFGLIPALLTEGFLRLNKTTCILFIILLLGAFLRFHNLSSIPFIGDYAWFYLSARDMILTGSIPLVGIPTSHPWLHQGALWTYLLAIPLSLTHFNPYSPAYFSSLIDMIALILIYKLGSIMFSQKTGIIAAAFYAISPLIIFNARIPYHTNPIPLFTILFIIFLYKFVKGDKKYFPLSIASLAILYNFQISTFLLSIGFLIVIIFGMYNKREWFKNILTKKILLTSAVAFLIPMLPMLAHDINNQFPQTLKFIAWLGYKILLIFGYPPLNPNIPSSSINDILLFLSENYQRLIYAPNAIISLIIGIFTIGFFYAKLFTQILQKKYYSNYLILLIIFTICLLGIIFAKVPSDAYLPIIFPPLILITAIFFSELLNNKVAAKFIYIPLLFVIFGNTYYFINNNYMFSEKHFGQTLNDKIIIANQIIKLSNGKEYNLSGEGPASQFDSFTMHYEYLTWWLGKGPSHSPKKLQIIIREENGKIYINNNQK